MACFVAPAVEAIVVTVLAKRAQKKEAVAGLSDRKPVGQTDNALPWSRKLGWLKDMLWGGVLLLAVEHIWHGEVVPWPPFFYRHRRPGGD